MPVVAVPQILMHSRPSGLTENTFVFADNKVGGRHPICPPRLAFDSGDYLDDDIETAPLSSPSE
jgi:hypothetical protein